MAQTTQQRAQEALDAIERAEHLLSRSDRECSGGICIWHRYSPMQMGDIASALIEARYAAGAAAGVKGY